MQIAVGSSSTAGRKSTAALRLLRPDLAYLRLAIVNVVFYGPPGQPGWVLIDAGIMGSAQRIRRAARARYGDARPAAILLTHGHFDHVGTLPGLAEEWDVPVYAHPREFPYLDGTTSVPPPDPRAGGGLLSLLSPLYPRGPVDLGSRLTALPDDGSVPPMPGWRWIATSGHTPGHVSLWRQGDRTLISGDAVISTSQESAFAVTVQKPEVHGPPKYFTPDWFAAARSVEKLAALEPDLLVTGHGPALHGPDMRHALKQLAADFDRIAVPTRGRYVESMPPSGTPPTRS